MLNTRRWVPKPTQKVFFICPCSKSKHFTTSEKGKISTARKDSFDLSFQVTGRKKGKRAVVKKQGGVAP